MLCAIKTARWLLPLTVVTFFIIVFSFPAVAKENGETPVDFAESTGKTLLGTLQTTIEAESALLEKLSQRFKQQQGLQKAVSIAIDAYNIQNIVHNNLLLQPETAIISLERAQNDSRSALDSVIESIKELTTQRDADVELLNRTKNQISLSSNQKAEIENTAWAKEEKDAIITAIRKLGDILERKLNVLENVINGLNEVIRQYDTVRSSTVELSEKMEAQVKTRQSDALFERKVLLSKAFQKEGLKKELETLADNLRHPFKRDLILAIPPHLRAPGAIAVLLFIFLVLLTIFIVSRLRNAYLAYEKKNTVLETHRWRLIAVKVLRRSLWIIGALFVFFCWDALNLWHERFFYVQTVFNLLLIYLLLRWLRDYLTFRKAGATLFIPDTAAFKLKRMALWVSAFAAIYVILKTAAVEESTILAYGRLFIEIYLLICCIGFWRAIENANRESNSNTIPDKKASYRPVMFLTYVITLGALAIELIGFPVFALYWLLSWARTLAVLFWAVILFRAISEWRAECLPDSDDDDEEPVALKYPLERVLISLAWLGWFCGCIVMLALAWNTRPNAVNGIYAILNQSFSVGKITLNSLDLLVAVLVLFLTLIMTRLARFLITQKIFRESDLEPGLRASITAIASYLIWGGGVILALSIIGFSTTSLTVAFGALGIGLGFGLQTIFNNFFSGIILLFERPIQVGDDLEINGTWATVKKINVRATVVQTYDNASLIIPNSEFISNVVKNWSFKNRRLRRDIDVGVAYGSDLGLVRRTLLDIADKTPRVLKYPRPEVVFVDFGDSALIFRLRIWTDIDHMVKAPTAIRFDIDERFRENGIEIAFPQRDIHIRSSGNTPGDLPSGTPAQTPPTK